MKIIDLKFLKDHRRYAIALILISVGLIPPPDILSTIIEALPLIVLYEATVWANSIISRRQVSYDVCPVPERF